MAALAVRKIVLSRVDTDPWLPEGYEKYPAWRLEKFRSATAIMFTWLPRPVTERRFGAGSSGRVGRVS
jgi:hypothetical protein